jgi:N-formylglutamate amidohydrolase
MNPSSPAFRVDPAPARVPVLLSVPHAGQAYTSQLLALSRHPASTLALLEDPYVDRLIDDGVAAGAVSIVALAPRAEIDLNRARADFDPAMLAQAPTPAGPISTRASAGLGLIPSRLNGHGGLWRRGLAVEDVERRIDNVYEPYHLAVASALRGLVDRFGVAVLLDCHSMPARACDQPRVVLGDRGGQTCDEWLMATAEGACTAGGLPTVRNDPYAGGEIVRRHGNPPNNVHAVQLEFDRGLYMTSARRVDPEGVARVSLIVRKIVRAAAGAATSWAQPIAAE